MTRSSKRIHYTKPTYIQKSITVIPGSLEHIATPTRKPSVCLAKGVRFQRPPRPFPQHTRRRRGTKNDRECTRRLRPRGACTKGGKGGEKRPRTYAKASPPGLASLSTCSPTRFARLFTNQRFALRLGSSTLACSRKGEKGRDGIHLTPHLTNAHMNLVQISDGRCTASRYVFHIQTR